VCVPAAAVAAVVAALLMLCESGLGSGSVGCSAVAPATACVSSSERLTSSDAAAALARVQHYHMDAVDRQLLAYPQSPFGALL
jgi:hypothetical protein